MIPHTYMELKWSTPLALAVWRRVLDPLAVVLDPRHLIILIQEVTPINDPKMPMAFLTS